MLRLLLFALILGGGGATPTLEVEEAPPPAGVSDQIRPTLSERLFRVRLGSDSTAEFWFRAEMPVDSDRQGGLGVNFGVFEPGALVGVVRFSTLWMDYKHKPVKPGVYGLRYYTQPADGDHTGASLYRDFLLLVPAAADQDPDAQLTLTQLVDLSRKASGTTHPAVMGLFPVWEVPDQDSVLVNELDQPILVLKKGDLTLGLVLSGHGEIEGY